MRVERWGLAAMGLGVLLWLAAPAWMDLGYDASAYVATGHGFARTGELVLAWGDVLTFAPAPEGHSHHFPPAYPLYLGFVFKLFGYGLAQAKWAAVAASLLALAVAYACTRDLYGRTAAAVVGGLLALSPHLLWVTGMGYSEGLATALFTLTMWAIVRSLRDERFIVPGGLFAGVAYLARASMGAFFLIAGLAGLAWRVRHRGWVRTFSSPWYGLAIVLFALVVGAWAWRNVALFGWPNWETSVGSRGIPRWVWEHRPEFRLGLLVRAPLMLSVLAPWLVLLWPEARRSFRRIREESTSGLWLAVVLVWVLGLLFAAAYFSMGPTRHEMLRLDTMRYVMVGVVPLAWALVREADWDAPGTRRRWLALGGAMLAGCVLLATFPPHYLPAQAARAVDPWLREGDDVAIAGAGKYAIYAYVSDPVGLDVYVDGTQPEGVRPEWRIALWPQDYEGYVKVTEETLAHPWWPATDDYAAVWVREDVAAERGVAAGEMRPGW
ncbi:MAG TPA: glycosyltransferase family 39 protein [Candidatus Thermoplasmatota archaeon]|nr:glycosyltransferase family 39 protein [Candidatus Thermoplasmatota archaeon]